MAQKSQTTRRWKDVHGRGVRLGVPDLCWSKSKVLAADRSITMLVEQADR